MLARCQCIPSAGRLKLPLVGQVERSCMPLADTGYAPLPANGGIAMPDSGARLPTGIPCDPAQYLAPPTALHLGLVAPGLLRIVTPGGCKAPRIQRHLKC